MKTPWKTVMEKDPHCETVHYLYVVGSDGKRVDGIGTSIWDTRQPKESEAYHILSRIVEVMNREVGREEE